MDKILKFSASWCAPCKQLSKILVDINTDVPIEELDVEENQELAIHYGIRNVPVLVAIEDGKEVARLVGMKSKEQVTDWITVN